MTVTNVPRAPETQDERSVEEHIAELQALIEEARRRARRRRVGYAAAVLVAIAGVITGAAGIGGGGVGVDASVAQGEPASATRTSRAREAPIAESLRYISAIHVDPKRPNLVYASTLGPQSMLKSTDAGKTWSVVEMGLTEPASPTDSEDLRVDASALDPRSPNVLYAGTGVGVFKTTDGARTWRRATTGIGFGGDPFGHRILEGFIWAIAIDPLQTSTVYAAGNGVWKSTNGGATWKRVLQHGAINLGIDPRKPEIVYASGMKGFHSKATRNSIYKTVDGGRSWRATGPTGLADLSFGHPIVVDRRPPGTIYAAGAAGLFASANHGRTWRKLLSGTVGAIALDPSHANVLYVGTYKQGVSRSEDGGQTWSAPRLAGRSVSAIAIASTRPQTIYAGVQWETKLGETHGGIFASTNGGATWRRLI